MPTLSHRVAADWTDGLRDRVLKALTDLEKREMGDPKSVKHKCQDARSLILSPNSVVKNEFVFLLHWPKTGKRAKTPGEVVGVTTADNARTALDVACRETLGLRFISRQHFQEPRSIRERDGTNECIALKTSSSKEELRELDGAFDVEINWYLVARDLDIDWRVDRLAPTTQVAQDIDSRTLLMEIGIGGVQKSLSMEKFLEMTSSCEEIFILQNALPKHEVLHPLWRGDDNRGRTRVVLYDPESSPHIEEREAEIDDPDRERYWLRERICESIRELLQAHSRMKRNTAALYVALTVEKIPFIMYGTNLEIRLGWPLMNKESNNSPQLVIKRNSPLYDVLLKYFDYFWGKNFDKKMTPDRLKSKKEKGAARVRTMREAMNYKFEMHVALSKRCAPDQELRVSKLQVPRDVPWERMQIKSTDHGPSSSPDGHGHTHPDGIGSVYSVNLENMGAAFELAEMVGKALQLEPNTVIEVEYVLWDNADENAEFENEFKWREPRTFTHIQKAAHAEPFEAHFTFKSLRASLDKEFINRALKQVNINYAELSWIEGGTKVIATQFFATHKQMSEECLKVSQEMMTFLEREDPQRNYRFKITAEQVLLCVAPKAKSQKGRAS